MLVTALLADLPDGLLMVLRVAVPLLGRVVLMVLSALCPFDWSAEC